MSSSFLLPPDLSDTIGQGLEGLYYDGHDYPNVVKYHQHHFLPMLKMHEPWLVRYVPGDETKELIIELQNYVECQLVLSPHNKTINQANDSHGKGWVYMNEFLL